MNETDAGSAIDPTAYLLECLILSDGPATSDTIPLTPLTAEQAYEAALQQILDAFEAGTL